MMEDDERLHPEGAPGIMSALGRMFAGDAGYEQALEDARVAREHKACMASAKRMRAMIAVDHAHARANIAHAAAALITVVAMAVAWLTVWVTVIR